MRWTHGLISSTVVLVGYVIGGCSNLADDCANTSSCSSGGATSNAGSSGSAGESGTSGNDSGGSDTGGEGGSTTAGSSSGTSGDAGATGLGGEGGSASQPCDGACADPTPVCKEASDTCVECLAPGDCAAGEETLCDTTSNTCVECLAPADCDTAGASRCAGGACVECEDSNDCAHIAGKGVCDGGECVQCTTADETGCAGKSCNPATNSCTDSNVGSVGTCKPCVADSECTGGNVADPTSRCVPMEFNATPRQGGFCLRRVAKTCSKPFQIPISASSLSGAPSESYCGIDQENVRCEAVLDLDMECSTGADTLARGAQLSAAQRAAESAKRGLWASCEQPESQPQPQPQPPGPVTGEEAKQRARADIAGRAFIRLTTTTFSSSESRLHLCPDGSFVEYVETYSDFGGSTYGTYRGRWEILSAEYRSAADASARVRRANEDGSEGFLEIVARGGQVTVNGSVVTVQASGACG